MSGAGISGTQIQVLDLRPGLLLCRCLRLLRGLLLRWMLVFRWNCDVMNDRTSVLGISYPPIPASKSETTADDTIERFMMLSFCGCGGIAAVKRR